MICTLTHRGWFGWCPVYLGDLTTECPLVVPRHWLFEPLLWSAECMFLVAGFCMLAMDPACEPAWPLRVTGKLGEPRYVQV